jgi:hypothetical protein
MERALAVAMVLSVGCVSTHAHRRHHAINPVAAAFAVGAAALTVAARAAPAERARRAVVADPRIPPPDAWRPATFEGWVIADDGRGPVPFTVVSLISRGESIRVLTNRDGHFKIARPLEPGDYGLSVIDESWEGHAETRLEEGVVAAVVVRAHRAR